MNIERITLTRNCLKRLRISGYTLVDAVKLKEQYGIELDTTKNYLSNTITFKIVNIKVLTFAKIKYGF